MALLQCSGISLSYGERVLLKDIGFPVEDRARLALAGANGCGKSTLLRILAGLMEADQGSVVAKTGTRIRYLAQSGIEFRDVTIFEAADAAFEEDHAVARRVEVLGQEIARVEGSLQARLLTEHHELQESLLNRSYHERSGRIAMVLEGLGFRQSQWDDMVRNLSGGWQMRLALAQVLLADPDVMLLDEPTNYLDLETREWLLEWLGHFKGAVVLVSHDRFVLDTAIDSVAELYGGRLKVYPGSYKAYEEKRKLELVQVLAAWKKQQDEIATLERFVERFKAKATKASQAQSRVKMLEKIVPIEIPDGIRTVHFTFPAAPPSGETVLRLEGISKSYGSRLVLAGVDIEIKRGEKVALLGPNGAGKSTLLRLLSREEQAQSGTLEVGHNVRPAYFAQESETQLTMENSVYEEIESAAPIDMVPQLRTILGSFLFQDDDVFKPIGVLSGGERSRVSLVKMLLEPANLLILDEPTNHLDLTSKEILLDALKDFKGTVVFVSHDKYFIRDLATRIIALEPSGRPGEASKVVNYPGNLEYYEWRKNQTYSTGTAEAPSTTADMKTEPAPGSNQALRLDSKKFKADLRKLEKEESTILERIAVLEDRLKELDHRMGLEENYSSGDKMRRLQTERSAIESELEGVQEQWVQVAENLETLRNEA